MRCHGRAQLLAAIAAQAAEQVAGEARRMQAHGHRARRIGLADDDGDVLREAVLVAEHGDLAVERIGERHARAAQELQCVVAEARRVMHDVAARRSPRRRVRVAVAFEADQRRHEPPGFRELERRGGERRAMRRGVDVERRAVDGRDAATPASARKPLEIRARREMRPRRRRSAGATNPRHARARRSRA